MKSKQFSNPFRPGAGHQPPYLAGREKEREEFMRLLKQEVILENLVLTGLRGVGKTVLLDTLKPLAFSEHWMWVGTDLSESASLSEDNIVIRLIADLSVVTSQVVIHEEDVRPLGFVPSQKEQTRLDYNLMLAVYNSTAGLVSDKLKAVLEFAWRHLKLEKIRGIVFAYDEAQNLSDHPARQQFPLSLMLDTFQSLQKKNIPFLLALTGLPTLFPQLVAARTYSERMFHVVTLERLDQHDSRNAILKPISDAKCPVRFSESGIKAIIEASGGYPYFIQFIGREAYDVYLQKTTNRNPIWISEITRKLDNDFFMGRWSLATDRQRELLWVIAKLGGDEGEFTVHEVSELSATLLLKPFSKSHINQMFKILSASGLVFRNRHGKYSFAVPLLGQFILRQNPPAGLELKPDMESSSRGQD